MNTELSYWIAAAQLPDIGPVTLSRWLNIFPNIKTLFSASSQELQKAGLSAKEIKLLKNPDWERVEKELQWAENDNCHIIPLNDMHYPPLLRETSGAPFILYAKGDITLLKQPQLAIVGSRNPSKTGSETAEDFAYYLAKSGFVITSGMATGIDASAHRGALSSGGKTIAVMGTGLNHIYPASNKELAHEIAEKGILISEFSPDTLPKAKHFPMRNRIISGLSIGVLIVEAAIRSGSLITARYAIEQGREVFAIPGSIHNPLARGCHLLIRQGAKLVETADDIIEELQGLIEMFSQTSVPLAHSTLDALDKKQKELLEQIGYEATATDVISFRSGLKPAEISSLLLSLELAGHVKTVPGGYVRNVN